MTYMDELFKYLSNKGINNNILNGFINIIICEEYDSESIVYDVINDTYYDSNILITVHKNCFDFITKFIKYNQSMFV